MAALLRAGRVMAEPHWVGNCYLESSHRRVLKVVQENSGSVYLRLRKPERDYWLAPALLFQPKSVAVQKLDPRLLERLPD